MFNKKRHNIKIDQIEKQIQLNGKITVCQLEELLNLNFEITFEYDKRIYEVIQNGTFIELHNDCFYENGKSKSLSFVRFSDSTEFIRTAEIQGKSIADVIGQIKILHY